MFSEDVDGHKILYTIERYDIETNKWTIMKSKLKNPLSNAAAIQN